MTGGGQESNLFDFKLTFFLSFTNPGDLSFEICYYPEIVIYNLFLNEEVSSKLKITF